MDTLSQHSLAYIIGLFQKFMKAIDNFQTFGMLKPASIN